MSDPQNRNTPINIPIPEQNDMVYYGDRFGLTCYQLGRSVADGGEGKIYNGTGGKAYKIYKPHRLTPAAIQKLEAMVGLKPHLNENICWPEALLFEPSEQRIPIGFSMKNINAKGGNIPTLEQLINNPGYHGKDWNRKSLVRVCIKIVEAFAGLHKAGILMGDVNPRNILVDENCNVFFIDVDSYQFGDYICPVGMPEYISPRIHKLGGAYNEIRRTPEDEQFAVTTILYRVLFLNAMPYPVDNTDIADAIRNYRFRFCDDYAAGEDMYIWKNLTPTIRQTFLRAYTEGVYLDNSTWKEQLNELYDWMEYGWVSDEFLPSEAINETDLKRVKFQKSTCTECGRSYKSIGQKQGAEALCARCRKSRENNRRIIHRLVCKNCKKPFTANPWDSNGADSENCLCPDCDSSASFPTADCSDKAVLQRQYEAILKNLEPKVKEDYI